MDWIRILASRCAGFFGGKKLDEDLDEELRSHLEFAVEENVRRGLSEQEAKTKALREFGGVTQTKEAYRKQQGLPFLETMLQDVRYTLRRLRKSPSFTLTAILTLALGIGATTAIFTLVHAVLLKSLPVKAPGQLWRVGDNEQCCVQDGLPDNNDWSLFSYEQYREFRDRTPGFESLAAFGARYLRVAVRRTGRNHPADSNYGEWVSGNAFDMLGLRPYAGRLLRPSDDVLGASPVAVMSFQLWEQRYGKDPSVIGATFLINKQPVTVIGIAPPEFYGERLNNVAPAFWFPLSLMPLLEPEQDLLDHPEQQWLNLIGRVAPGVNVATIQTRMQVELQQFLESPLSKLTGAERSLISEQYLRLTPGGGGVQRMQDNYKTDLHLLMWISGFVLLIACANLANLMLARSVTQRQQTSVQTALGAPRRRLVRRAFTECLALAILGGLAGLAVAWAGAKLILDLSFQHSPFSISARPAPAVLGFALAVSLLTGLLFGVTPAWIASHVEPIEALRGANRSTGRSTMWGQKALVVAQVAISAVLLCAAGFLILSLNRLQHRQFGFETAHRYILQIDPQEAGYKPDQLAAFYRQLHDTLTTIPGVINVAYSIYSPMSGSNWNFQVFIDDLASQSGQAMGASFDRVSPGYFGTIGTKLLEGRDFTESDNTSSRNVTIVNEAFIKYLLHGKNPIGMHFGDSDLSVAGTYEIVGVVQDTQYWDPDQPIPPMYFVPAAQWPRLPPSNPDATNYAQFIARSHYMGSVEIETRSNVPGLESQIQWALAVVNPNLPVVGFESFATQVERVFSQQSMIAQLTSLFGALALVLAAIGLYGVTAYAVTQRTSEIGVRMALGANRRHIQRMVLRGAFLQVAIGLVLGIPSAIFAGRLMASELFGVTSYNPMVLGTIVAVLFLVALVAASIPARRAASVDPIQALRME